MRKTFSLLLATTLACLLTIGCGKGWQMDYGKPAAQFHQKDLVSQGKAFVGKKVTVKGIVEKVDLSDPESPRVFLAGGIECRFGKMKAMAESCKAGNTVFVDGILKRCEPDDVLIDPAMLRDPTAPFSPMKTGADPDTHAK